MMTNEFIFTCTSMFALWTSGIPPTVHERRIRTCSKWNCSNPPILTCRPR